MIANDGWPFTERIAERGFPFIASTPALEEGNPPSRIEETFHQVRQIPPSRMRGWLASLMLQQLMEYYYREIPVAQYGFQGVHKSAKIRGTSPRARAGCRMTGIPPALILSK